VQAVYRGTSGSDVGSVTTVRVGVSASLFDWRFTDHVRGVLAGSEMTSA